MDLINPKITADYMQRMQQRDCDATHVSEVCRITNELELVEGDKNVSSVTSYQDMCPHVEEHFKGRGFTVTRLTRACRTPRVHGRDLDVRCPSCRTYVVIAYPVTEKNEKTEEE